MLSPGWGSLVLQQAPVEQEMVKYERENHRVWITAPLGPTGSGETELLAYFIFSISVNSVAGG